MTPRDAEVEIAGERLVLMPERTVFWPGARTLVVADLHWGKAATFRLGGIPIPSGMTRDDLDRLAGAIHRTAAGRLILLGDLFHARPGRRAERTLATIAAWRARHPALVILLVRGNHDRRAGDPPDELGVTVVDGPYLAPPFELRHEPAPARGPYVLAGHVHPACVVSGAGRQRERLPCFFFGPGGAVLPAFGSFTGTALIEPRGADRIYVVAGDSVIAVPA